MATARSTAAAEVASVRAWVATPALGVEVGLGLGLGLAVLGLGLALGEALGDVAAGSRDDSALSLDAQGTRMASTL